MIYDLIVVSGIDAFSLVVDVVVVAKGGAVIGAHCRSRRPVLSPRKCGFHAKRWVRRYKGRVQA